MTCPTCHRRRVAVNDSVCRACRRFIAEYIDSGRIRRDTLPSSANVLLTMRMLSVSQDRAVSLLGGTP